MSVIKPFKALRPVADKAHLVSSVPYDVIYDSEVREIIGANPLSLLRVTKPDAIVSDGDPLEYAKDALTSLIDSGILIDDATPSLFVYRLATADHKQTGIVACCPVSEYETGKIKRHEKTRPDKVKDRTDHMIALRAQTGLIFLAFRNTDRIRNEIANEVTNEPLYDFTSDDGVRQTVWRITQTDALTDAFAELETLYIADGHHRAESAYRSSQVLKEQNPDHTGDEDYNYVMAGIFPSEDLNILAYNRIVKDAGDLTDDEIIERIKENFVVIDADSSVPTDPNNFCMYLGGKWYLMNFAVNFLVSPGPIESLDVSILQSYVLSPIFGIKDPRTDERIGFVGGARGTEELEKMVDSGEARLAFSLYPTSMEDLFAVSDIDEIMPPKSTWFEPKLKDGLLIHRI